MKIKVSTSGGKPNLLRLEEMEKKEGVEAPVSGFMFMHPLTEEMKEEARRKTLAMAKFAAELSPEDVPEDFDMEEIQEQITEAATNAPDEIPSGAIELCWN